MHLQILKLCLTHSQTQTDRGRQQKTEQTAPLTLVAASDPASCSPSPPFLSRDSLQTWNHRSHLSETKGAGLGARERPHQGPRRLWEIWEESTVCFKAGTTSPIMAIAPDRTVV